MKDAPKIEAFEVYEKFQKRKNKVTSDQISLSAQGYFMTGMA
jgi:hypothetical protein